MFSMVGGATEESIRHWTAADHVGKSVEEEAHLR